MTLRAWYLRRAVPWTSVLACCAAAVAVAGLLHRWPGTAGVLMPTLLACCAAGAAFVFDEHATAAVSVTPRGSTWRRAARLSVTAVPLVVWSLVVLARPGDLAFSRPGWWLVGASMILATGGVAGLAARHEVAGPGAALAGGAALTVLAPVVVSGFLGWESVYPLGTFGEGVQAFWAGLALLAVGLAGVAMRPGVPR